MSPDQPGPFASLVLVKLPVYPGVVQPHIDVGSKVLGGETAPEDPAAALCPAFPSWGTCVARRAAGCPGPRPAPHSRIVSEGGACLRHLFLNLYPLVLWLQENIFQILQSDVCGWCLFVVM